MIAVDPVTSALCAAFVWSGGSLVGMLIGYHAALADLRRAELDRQARARRVLGERYARPWRRVPPDLAVDRGRARIVALRRQLGALVVACYLLRDRIVRDALAVRDNHRTREAPRSAALDAPAGTAAGTDAAQAPRIGSPPCDTWGGE